MHGNPNHCECSEVYVVAPATAARQRACRGSTAEVTSLPETIAPGVGRPQNATAASSTDFIACGNPDYVAAAGTANDSGAIPVWLRGAVRVSDEVSPSAVFSGLALGEVLLWASS